MQFFIVFGATTHVKATRAGNCGQRGFVVSIDRRLDVWHTAVTNLDCITVEYLVQWVISGNSSSIIFKKDCPTLVQTFLLYGGLYHIIFLLRLRGVFLLVVRFI
jgi:hypothetical protein